MPAGPGWPGSGLVVAVVSLFGVGPGWYRPRGGFARLCVWVGPARYHLPRQRPIFFFLYFRANLSLGNSGFSFSKNVPLFGILGTQHQMPPKKSQIKRETTEIDRCPAGPGFLRGGFI